MSHVLSSDQQPKWKNSNFGWTLDKGTCTTLNRQNKIKWIVGKEYREIQINDNLYFIPRPHKSSAYALGVFESKKFEMINKLREQFDYVIIDSPPVLPVSDVVLI